MPNYRRHYVPGGTFFFTVVTEDRRPMLVENRTLLRNSIEECRSNYPFEIVAMVLLPDHIHTIWTLPESDTDYSKRWSIIKRLFSQACIANGIAEVPGGKSRLQNRRLGIWQRRFWEHWVRDESELIDIVDYIHFNPMKHQLARCPHDWPHSTFHRFVKSGRQSKDWMCGCSTSAVTSARFFEPKWDLFE